MSDIINNSAEYKQGWKGGLPETECGSGSKLENTEIQRQWLPEMVEEFGITSIADIGAGDLNWIKRIELGCDYQGYDLVPRHSEVKEFNLLEDDMPEADCYMCLWVLNHFPKAQARAALARLLTGGNRFLITHYEPRMPAFIDIKPERSVVIRKRPAGDPRGDVDLRLIRC